MFGFIKKYKYCFLLLFISTLSFLGTLIYAPIYDYMDEFFPNRYFIVNGLSNGILPLWLPYNFLGTPIFADPQSNFFYFPLWFWTLFGDYTPIMWGIGTVFNGFMAGCGFFMLTRRFVKNDLTAFVMGSCYMMSGFFVGNMQHLPWIIGAVWLPWVINYFIDLMENPSLKNAILTAIVAALLFTGGYPGIPFILIYLLTIIVLYYSIVHCKQKNRHYFKQLIPLLLLCVGICFLLTLPELIGMWEIHHYISRGTSLNYVDASVCTLTIPSLVSLCYPLIACSEPEFTMTDISTGSIYVGVLTLFFSAIGLFQTKNGILKILLYWGLFCFLLSFGKLLPVHRWAFEWMPLMNFIRMPPLFRIFAIIALLLLAAKGLDEVVTRFSKYRKPLFGFLLSGMAICLFLVIVCMKIKTPFTHKLLFCATIQIIIFVLIFIGLVWIKKQWQYPFVIMVWIMEMVLNTWLCLSHTGFDKNYTNKQFASLIKHQPKHFPIPKRITSEVVLVHEDKNWGHCWRNLGQIGKEIEYYGYSPVQLIANRELLTPYFEQQKELLLPSVAFFPKNVIYTTKPVLFSIDTAYTHNETKTAVFNDATDSALVTITRFEPCCIELHTYSNTIRPLVLCQNYYPGWKAKIKDGKSLPIHIMNHSLMSVYVPENETDIQFYFERTDIVTALWLSLVSWLGCLFFFVMRYYKKRLHK